jgi:hypothetical protein
MSVRLDPIRFRDVVFQFRHRISNVNRGSIDEVSRRCAHVRMSEDSLNHHVRHTPYLKTQLRSASHHLDDASAGLRHGAKAGPNDAAMWQGFAQLNLQIAGQLRQKVQAAVDKYGGPENIVEVGG